MKTVVMGVRVDVTNTTLSSILPCLADDFQASCVEVARTLPLPAVHLNDSVDYIDRFRQSLLDVRHRTITPSVPYSVSSVLHELTLPVANAWRLAMMGIDAVHGFLTKLDNIGNLAVSITELQSRAGEDTYGFDDFRSMWRKSCCNPCRVEPQLRPVNHPNPVWFFPFSNTP